MPRPALATVDDLGRLLGAAVPEDQQDQANALLEMASELVRAYARTDWLTEDGSATANVPGSIPGVVAGITERASRNPDGVTSETAGPFQRTYGPDAAARLYLTAGEKSIIAYAIGSDSVGIGVISTTRGPVETRHVHDPWDTVGAVAALEETNPWAFWGVAPW